VTRKILTISMIGNPADHSRGTLEGEILPPEAPPLSSGQHIRQAIHAVHDLGMRMRSHRLRAIALYAALELSDLKSRANTTSDLKAKDISHA
jgi:hypothetical protein